MSIIVTDFVSHGILMLFLLSGFFKCSFVWFMFYYYFLDASLFPNERQIKAMDFCGWEGSGIREKMRAIISIYCVKNSIINKITIIITDKNSKLHRQLINKVKIFMLYIA